jgi:hypothetical protein
VVENGQQYADEKKDERGEHVVGRLRGIGPWVHSVVFICKPGAKACPKISLP